MLGDFYCINVFTLANEMFAPGQPATPTTVATPLAIANSTADLSRL